MVIGVILDSFGQLTNHNHQGLCSWISKMDDEGDLVYEMNGNFTKPDQLCQPFGEDEVDSSRVMLSLGQDETDGSPSKTLSCSIIPDIHRLGKGKNDNDDDGYCSQDQLLAGMSQSQTHIFASIQRDEESALNNNFCPSLDPSLSEDTTGKVLGLRIPPNYIIRSNERRTSFSPNDNSKSQQLDNAGSNVGVQVEVIPSRLSLEHSRTNNINSPSLSQSDSGLSNTASQYCRKDTSSENISDNANQRTSTGLKRKFEGETPRPSDEAGVTVSLRKRKERDEDDGGDDTCMITPMPAEPDTKRMKTADIVPRQHLQAPLTRQQPRVGNSYDIQGNANYVVHQPQDCIFHIYQQQGSSLGGPPKPHTVEWAGVNIHQVPDKALKEAFEVASKAISVAFNWKKFARKLPVSRSPSLEKELSSLESCGGSKQEKAMAVLLRWWREEHGCRHDDEVKTKLRDGLEGCGLKRAVRDLDCIFKKGRP